MAKNDPIVLPADPDDLEDGAVTAAGMERGQRARLIRVARTKLGLSQAEFAAKFRVPVGTLRDWEQARATAPDFAIAYIRVIGQHPDLVAQVLEAT
jgi:putative transcriptional regulator